jgi:hypothetical protein
VFRGFDGQVWIEHLFGHLPQGQLPFLLFVCTGIFLLGFFLDFFEIAFIVVPLIAPVARKLGVDMVWFTVMVAVVLQTSFMHPPFGIALYNLRSVAPPEVRTSDIYLGAIPFLLLQMIMVGILVAFPGIASRPPPAATLTDKQVEDALRPTPDLLPEPLADPIPTDEHANLPTLVLVWTRFRRLRRRSDRQEHSRYHDASGLVLSGRAILQPGPCVESGRSLQFPGGRGRMAVLVLPGHRRCSFRLVDLDVAAPAPAQRVAGVQSDPGRSAGKCLRSWSARPCCRLPRFSRCRMALASVQCGRHRDHLGRRLPRACILHRFEATAGAGVGKSSSSAPHDPGLDRRRFALVLGVFLGVVPLLLRGHAMPFVGASVVLFAVGPALRFCAGTRAWAFGMALTACRGVVAFVVAVGSVIARVLR